MATQKMNENIAMEIKCFHSDNRISLHSIAAYGQFILGWA